MFAAISGLAVHQNMLDVTANNIANVNTIGFKSERTSFEDALSQLEKGAASPTPTSGGTDAEQIGLGVRLGSINNVMTGGAVETTGNPYDVAIQGDGFFRVVADSTTLGAAGASYMYTRAGNFTTDANGDLVTNDGDYVVGFKFDASGNPLTGAANETKITIPAGSQSVTIAQNGTVSVTDSAGAVTKVAVISLATFPNNAGLVRVGGNNWTASSNSGAETANIAGTNGLGTLTPGAVEMSNVNLAQEFTNMITAERGFQANSRVISTADEMLQELVNLKH
ncbi:MAG TPA: flagellar hook-basal body complex protein [Gaiellales bacterium]|jgi:flagellar hook protein FlgE|nr:flagellar hook-basal body complex protein [Gaiellales bacterium]